MDLSDEDSSVLSEEECLVQQDDEDNSDSHTDP